MSLTPMEMARDRGTTNEGPQPQKSMSCPAGTPYPTGYGSDVNADRLRGWNRCHSKLLPVVQRKATKLSASSKSTKAVKPDRVLRLLRLA